ncbi:hypothetical protein EV426DRAFT_612975 [Tirmania nivea]|nr:hypothetical protein EV426DRAFT_612975 [Tirmania nivea]
MNSIQNITPVGETLLTIPINIDIDTDQIVSDIENALSGVKSAASDDLRKISAPLEEYFGKLGEEIKSNMTSITSALEQIDWADEKSIMDGLQPILGYLKPVFEFIAENPWVLVPILIPVFQLFFVLLGFTATGVVAGSVAAIIQSSIGNVPAGSTFSFLQSKTSGGAGGWALRALVRSNMFIAIAVIMVAVGIILVDEGIVDPDEVSSALEGAWNSTVEIFDSTTVPSVGSQLVVLNLDIGWVPYGVWAWLLMYGAVHAGAF